ncbi:Ig-like domain-containing protein [Methanolobus sp. ZRKC5]|uniref:cadherin-like domain-containing protein n=1 Tax=unclassified Methanolobus TaxID=2629569 RepID=UPI00313C94E7
MKFTFQLFVKIVIDSVFIRLNSYIKTTSDGTEEWNNTFGTTSSDYAYSVQQTDDDGYIIAGQTNSYGAGSSDAWLIKTDQNGTEEWNQTFGRIVDDYARSVMQVSDSGYVFAGRTSLLDESYNFIDYGWLVKTDDNGNHVWNQTFGGNGSDYTYSVTSTNDGGYVLAGETNSFGTSSHDAWLIKTDSNGNEEWNRTFDGYDGSYSDEAHSAKQTSDGGFIVAGEKTNLGGSRSIWLIKTDSNGNATWNKSFGSPQSGKYYDVWSTDDGGYVITGNTESPAGGYKYDGWIIKTDSQGNELWNKTLGGDSNDYLYSLTMTDDNEFIAVGDMLPDGLWYTEAWMIKLEAESLFIEVNESELLTITFNATDIDGDSVTYNTNATFGTLVDNIFTWTPDYDDNGTYYVEFNVSDGSMNDTEIVTLTVNNVIPEFINFSVIKMIESGTSINSFNITLNQTSLVDYNMTGIRVYDIVPVNFTIAGSSPGYNESQNNKYYWNLDLVAGESKNITYVLTGTGEYHVTDLFNTGAGHS